MKTLISEYVFNPVAKTIVFTCEQCPKKLSQLLLITNVSTNTIIYNFANNTQGGTLSDNVLTLTYDTTSMSAGDSLQIYADIENSFNVIDMVTALKNIFNVLSYPAWLDRSLNRLRGTVIVESGTVTTVTTCTTVTGITNLDSYQAKLPVINQNLDAWANVVRRNIT